MIVRIFHISPIFVQPTILCKIDSAAKSRIGSLAAMLIRVYNVTDNQPCGLYESYR